MNETTQENEMKTLETQLYTGCTNCGSYSLQTECQLDEQGDTETGYLLRLECRTCGLTQWTQECSEKDYQKSKFYENK
jgi:hypothetical protein